jgi:hypothetical protein
MVQLVGGPFHGDTVDMGEGKPLVVFDQTSCMEGARYSLDPEQRAYYYEGTPSTEEAVSLLHWFEPFLREHEDDDKIRQRCEGVRPTGEPECEAEGQDEVPPEPKIEVQETLW